MNLWQCAIPDYQVHETESVALSVPTNPYFRVWRRDTGPAAMVIVSTESYDAIVAAGLSIVKRGPA